MKWLKFLIIVGLMLGWSSAVFAQESWTIEKFQSDIAIQHDGSVLIEEVIEVDFGTAQKHGIYRDMPYVYTNDDGSSLYTRISDIEVLQDGAEANTQVTRNSGNVRIRIGNPDETISGQHTYALSYRAVGILQAYDGFDELAWNVTGSEWEAPIQSASARVTVPAEIIQTACYEGAYGSTSQCSQASQDTREVSFLTENLAPGEGMTVSVGFQSGVVPIVAVEAPPSFVDLLSSPVVVLIAVAVGVLGIVVVLYRWYHFGRDRWWQRSHLPGVRSDRDGMDLPEKTLPLFFRQPVSVEYDPPDQLRPAELGVLLDEKAHTLDVTATIVDLAARGWLTITEIPKSWVFGKRDYELQKTGKQTNDLMRYEQMLLEKLFADQSKVTLSALENSFYRSLEQVKKQLYQDVVEKKLFAKNPEKVRGTYTGIAGGIFLLGIAMGALSIFLLYTRSDLDWYLLVLAGMGIGLTVNGLVALVFSRFMPRKTAYGRELYERARGYELFVSGTEKYRAKFYEKEGLFMEVLPYAIVFGVTDQLARAFREMGVEPAAPAWFHGASAFHLADFTASMNTFSKSLSTAIASTPQSSSGGGGFSGGGFGGGGGGSW